MPVSASVAQARQSRYDRRMSKAAAVIREQLKEGEAIRVFGVFDEMQQAA